MIVIINQRNYSVVDYGKDRVNSSKMSNVNWASSYFSSLLCVCVCVIPSSRCLLRQLKNYESIKVRDYLCANFDCATIGTDY